MATSGRDTGMVGYNVQTAVELASMAKQARSAMGKEDLTVVATRGYFKGEEIVDGRFGLGR